MNILIIANGVVGKNPGMTGGEVRWIEIAKYWASEGHRIYLMSSYSGKVLCDRMGLEVRLCETTKDTDESRKAFIKRMWGVIKRTKDLPRPDVVYSANEQLYDVLPGLFLKLRYGKKVKWATVVHWLPPFLFWKRKMSKWYNSLLFLISERVSLYLSAYFSDILLAVSATTKNQMMKCIFDKTKINIVSCGVNTDFVDTLPDEEKVYDAVYMKRMQSTKGGDLVDIWAKVVEKNEDAQLLVIGSGEYSGEFKRKIAEHCLEDNITIKPWVYNVYEKFKYLKQSKCMILPSYEENWAIVIGEAMACKVPVIAYQLPELDAVWGDNYQKIKVGDLKNFADAIVEPKVDTEKAYKYVQKYGWKDIAEKELNLIKRLERQRW